MKRYSFFILIFLMLLLSGCNLPQSNPTPTVNLVGTQVSQVLTAQPTSTTVPTTAPIEPTNTCLLYTSDAADDLLCVDLGGRRIIKKKNKKTSTES